MRGTQAIVSVPDTRGGWRLKIDTNKPKGERRLEGLAERHPPGERLARSLFTDGLKGDRNRDPVFRVG